jgi:hypothetical protein
MLRVSDFSSQWYRCRHHLDRDVDKNAVLNLRITLLEILKPCGNLAQCRIVHL